MKAILIGYGEVGKGLYEVLSKHHEVFIHDPALERLAYDDAIGSDFLLISIPYNDKFLEIVLGYQVYYKTNVTVIFSTVPVGTCEKLRAIHSPIEGRHDNMTTCIKEHIRWIGGNIAEDMELAKEFFEQAVLAVMQAPDSRITEFLKLQSLAIYGINIKWAEDCKRVTDNLGFDYNLLKKYNQDYNNLVEANGHPEHRRYILDPPVGRIGGHCVLAGMNLLQNTMDNPFIQRVLGKE